METGKSSSASSPSLPQPIRPYINQLHFKIRTTIISGLSLAEAPNSPSLAIVLTSPVTLLSHAFLTPAALNISVASYWPWYKIIHCYQLTRSGPDIPSVFPCTTPHWPCLPQLPNPGLVSKASQLSPSFKLSRCQSILLSVFIPIPIQFSTKITSSSKLRPSCYKLPEPPHCLAALYILEVFCWNVVFHASLSWC